MNRLATSKEDILAASRELIKENGWAAVSIRSVAAKCSVSAGTIYNYYESKAELLGATIESVWQEIFFHPEDEQVFHDVTTCISWIYERFKYGNKRFPGFFSLHSFGFMKEGKDDGKKRMMRTWEHILNGLCEVLKNDPEIRPGVFAALSSGRREASHLSFYAESQPVFSIRYLHKEHCRPDV